MQFAFFGGKWGSNRHDLHFMNRAYRKATERKEEMRTREKKGKRRGNDKILGGLMFLGQDVPDSLYVGN